MKKDRFESAGEIVMIPAEMIRPNQLRQTPDDDMEDLIFSIIKQ